MFYPSWLLLSDRGGVEYKLGVDKQPDLGFKTGSEVWSLRHDSGLFLFCDSARIMRFCAPSEKRDSARITRILPRMAYRFCQDSDTIL